MLFEGVQGLGGFKRICQNRQFSLLKQLMHIGSNVNSYGTQLRNRYRTTLLPEEHKLLVAVEEAYKRGGYHTDTIDFLKARGVRPPDDGEDAHKVVVARDTGVEPAAFIEKPHPEATLAAIRARMNPFFLDEEECSHKLFTAGLCGGPRRPSLAQLDLRLHIVREWYRDVSTRLDIYTALRNVPVLYHDLGIEVFTYLESRGAINFGAVPPDAIARKMLNDYTPGRRREVAIVGAGLAGIAAARLLRSYDVVVTVLEARARPGGRVHTDLEKEVGAPVDLGAMLITGMCQNPLESVARQVGATTVAVDDEDSRPLWDIDGTQISEEELAEARFEHIAVMEATAQFRKRGSTLEMEDMSLGEIFQCALERSSWRRSAQKCLDLQGMDQLQRQPNGTVHVTPIGQKELDSERMAVARLARILRWLLANVEYALASNVWNASLLHWDHNDDHAFAGEHLLVPDGFSKIVDGLVSGLDADIRYSHSVKEIVTQMVPGSRTGETYVTVKAELPGGVGQTSGNFDAVIVTSPLGVLKAGDLKFTPPLPEEKREAISRLGNGGLVKVVLAFESVFWGSESAFGALRDSVGARGEHYYFWNLHKYTKKPILVSLITEPSVTKAEATTDDRLKEGAMRVLRQCFPLAPEPQKVHVTRWSQDEFTRGAYSHVRPGCFPEDYDVLAEAKGSPLHFAGEHTYRKNPGNAASAFLSGYEAAGNALQSFGLVLNMAVIHRHMFQSALKKGAREPAQGKENIAARGVAGNPAKLRPQTAGTAGQPSLQMSVKAVERSLGRLARGRGRVFEKDLP